MGRITKLQNDVGHLQGVLSMKNRMILELQAELRKLKEQIENLTKPKDKAA